MRIGASFNFPQLPQRSASAESVAARSGKDRASAPPQPQSDFSADFTNARTRWNPEADSFYSTQRTLPLRGQEAMQTYRTNAGFQFAAGAAQSELVGVDIYA